MKSVYKKLFFSKAVVDSPTIFPEKGVSISAVDRSG